MFKLHLIHFYPTILTLFILNLILNCVALNDTQCNDNLTTNCNSSKEESSNQTYVPHGPLIPCENLPSDFYQCETPLDLKGDSALKAELGHGCVKFGGQKYEDVERTYVNCTALTGIDCFGKRKFQKQIPCIKYTGHYFVTTLVYSILLGFLGLDRFSLGHTGTAIGKILTLGGLGIWWIVDIVLLITGNLTPEDGSNWTPVA